MNLNEGTYGFKGNENNEDINTLFTNNNKFLIGFGVFALLQFSILLILL
ncbi:hypothetical protein KO500_05005 [Cellulophaga baltica]|nr:MULTISPECIES: hypothetical protein [Cellulophaga]MBU2995778.1 hypothetical protein [Cellulophaga baltica]